MPGGEKRVCWRVLFSGRVQGVGFRYRTERLAGGFDVAGHVRNLPDGRVELLAEGLEREVERFVAAVEDHMAGCIRDRVVTREPPTGAWPDFRIAF